MEQEQKTPEQLADEWLAAKAEEEAAAKRRGKVERELAKLLQHPEDGSKSHKLPGFKITMTGRLNFKADVPRLLNLVAALPENMRPIKQEPALDATGAKWIRKHEPNLWATIAPAITVTPGKVGVKVERVEEEED